MFQSLRLSMSWLHTWFGLVLGFVLMAVFFFGALSVFDRELDRWALPQTRFEPQPLPSFDEILAPAFRSITKPDPQEIAAARSRIDGPIPEEWKLLDWSVYTTHRDPVLTLYASFALPNADNPFDHIHGHVTIDPRTGKPLAANALKIGSEFFYPLHYSLHLDWKGIGYWIVAIAALTMLAALVSGVVIHRKLFREFFTFRRHKQRQRSVLDLHNLTGVVALPFHFMFALSGLIIFADIYFPVSETLLQRQAMAFEQAKAERSGLAFEPSGVPAPLASVDLMMEEAKRYWASQGMEGEIGFLMVNHIGDRASSVSIYRAGTDRLALAGEAVHFEGATGKLISVDPPVSRIESVNEFVMGLHLQHFRHWLLRALYFIGGIAGCVCIATGFIFFVEKRKRQHAEQGSAGARWVDAFAVTTVTGMVIATLTLLVTNRLLLEDMLARDAWQRGSFWIAWLISFVHAGVRSRPVAQAKRNPAWVEQTWAIAGLAAAAAVLNWITTGDHLLRTIGQGYWPVAGVDLMLLATAAIAAMTARRLGALASVAATTSAAPEQAAHA